MLRSRFLGQGSLLWSSCWLINIAHRFVVSSLQKDIPRSITNTHIAPLGHLEAYTRP